MISPEDFNDLAEVIDRAFVPMQEGSVVRALIPVFREEAARREAEAKHVCDFVFSGDMPGALKCRCGRQLTPKEPGRLYDAAANVKEGGCDNCPTPTGCRHEQHCDNTGLSWAKMRALLATQGEREGPGSAAAHKLHDITGPAWGFVSGTIEDKPAPAHWKGSTLDPECKPAPAGDRNLVTDASTLVFKQLEASEARVRELEAQILSHIQANDVSCKGWAAEKARADRLAAAIRDIDRACNMAEVHRIAVDALASKGGDRG